MSFDGEKRLARSARSNIERDFSDIEADKAAELSERLAAITHADHLQQHRHDLGIDKELSEVLAKGVLKRLFPSTRIPRVLVDFDRYLDRPNAEGIHRLMGMKGVSATLESVDQLGDWTKGSDIDDKFRSLPNSRLLDLNGFEFLNTYGDKSKAQLSYDFRLIPSTTDTAVKGWSMMAVRKRAAADVQNSSGRQYDIVKRSSMFVDVPRLTRAKRRLFDRVMREISHDKQPDPSLVAELGDTVIEPFVGDKGVRQSPEVLPATSTYFVLHRFERDKTTA